jgi:hypothetical protein
MNKKISILVLLIFFLLFIIIVPIISIFLELFRGNYYEEVVLITRVPMSNNVTEPISNITASDIPFLPKRILSEMQKMILNETIRQTIVKINNTEREQLIQLLERIGTSSFDGNPRFVYFENVLFEIAISAIIS